MRDLLKRTAGICLLMMLMAMTSMAQEGEMATAQEEQPAAPPIEAVSKWHWNWDHTEGTPEDWLAIEKEYHEKVTMKNEYILHQNVLNHYFTDDNSEVLVATMYASWGDMEKANQRNNELAEEAWPDEAERDAFFKRRNAYYADEHSDELYTVLNNGLYPEAPMEESKVYYVQRRHMAFPDDLEIEELMALRKEFVENVYHKIPGMHMFHNVRHRWGSDGRDLIEVMVFDDLASLETGLKSIEGLIDSHWPEEEARRAFFDRYGKIFTPWHADYIYQNVPELMK